MNKPTRHELKQFLCNRCNQPDAELFGMMVSHDEGRWVSYEDYARAKANSDAYVRSLEARIERLKMAGYAMAIKINVHGIKDRFTDSQKLVDDWSNAAKEGKTDA